MRKNSILILLPIFCFLVLFTGCFDMFTDREFHIEDNLYVIYSTGDGCRLARKENNNNYSTEIINSTLYQVYKKDDMLFVEAEPANTSADTLFYKVWYKKPGDKDSISPITRTEFNLLKKGLKGIIPVGK